MASRRILFCCFYSWHTRTWPCTLFGCLQLLDCNRAESILDNNKLIRRPKTVELELSSPNSGNNFNISKFVAFVIQQMAFLNIFVCICTNSLISWQSKAKFDPRKRQCKKPFSLQTAIFCYSSPSNIKMEWQSSPCPHDHIKLIIMDVQLKIPFVLLVRQVWIPEHRLLDHKYIKSV